jgi:hypothetical protein
MWWAGHAYEAELHRVRLADLLDLAARNGIDTTGWVAPAVAESRSDRAVERDRACSTAGIHSRSHRHQPHDQPSPATHHEQVAQVVC